MFFNKLAVAFALAASTTVFAAPTAFGSRGGPHGGPQVTGCSLANARLSLPSGQTTLAPQNGAPEYVAVGLGVQNYTCQSGAWTSVGAVASLFDVSCFTGESYFKELPSIALELSPKIDAAEALGAKMRLPAPWTQLLDPILFHFFVANPVSGGTGLDPRFNHAGSSAFSTLSKTASLNAPDGSANVAWLQLTEVAGSLASSVYRVDTVKGQPPTGTCSSSKVLSVPYAAQYWFFK